MYRFVHPANPHAAAQIELLCRSGALSIFAAACLGVDLT